MKTHVHLSNCTRPTIERKRIEGDFKAYLDDVVPPETLLHLKNHFDHASTRHRALSEYKRLYTNAFWFAAKGTKRKENKSWEFYIEIS
jgi:hypothetical protein